MVDVNFALQEFADTTKKEENIIFKQDNFSWNFDAPQSQNDIDSDNLNSTGNARQVAIDSHDIAGINFEQKAFFKTKGKG